ncbi:hypothetical protein C8J56DRAFT_1048532 [Mycena floridula]|nr:hypothetical protein C8J56DRAFT_1048532 [Mycena floridula]
MTTIIDDSDPSIRYWEGWTSSPGVFVHNGATHVTQQVGATATISFSGWRFDDTVPSTPVTFLTVDGTIPGSWDAILLNATIGSRTTYTSDHEQDWRLWSHYIVKVQDEYSTDSWSSGRSFRGVFPDSMGYTPNA